MIDWVAAGCLITAVLAGLGAAISFGVMRQRVADLKERDAAVNGRVDKQDLQFERVWKALDGLNHTNQAVTALQGSIETLTAQMNAGHALMLSKLEASDKLTAAKLDTLATSMGRAAKT